jgi:hypothetical protein
MTRLLVVGLDGGTDSVIGLPDANLPNIAEVREQGASGTLISTVPPITAAAWPSMMTGWNPGRHGMYDFRTLGLGYANLGALLMVQGIPYDSPEARAQAGAITALMHASSYATSAEIAGELGPFPCYAANRAAMLRVIANHRRAANNAPGRSGRVPARGLSSSAGCADAAGGAHRSRAWAGGGAG